MDYGIFSPSSKRSPSRSSLLDEHETRTSFD